MSRRTRNQLSDAILEAERQLHEAQVKLDALRIAWNTVYKRQPPTRKLALVSKPRAATDKPNGKTHVPGYQSCADRIMGYVGNLHGAWFNYKDACRALPDANQQTVSSTLHDLVRAGILEARRDSTKPHVAYQYRAAEAKSASGGRQ